MIFTCDKINDIFQRKMFYKKLRFDRKTSCDIACERKDKVM